MKLLQINSGIFTENSQSTQLADKFAQQWLAQNPGSERIVRDLIADPVPHLDANIITAFATEADQRTAEQTQVHENSMALIEELKSADAIVMGVPMYNFAVPSQLKAYFDHIARAGITFSYTENGPQGLLADKPVYVLAARGGIHKDQPTDTQTGFIKTILGFIGLKNVEIIYAEGLNMGDEAKAKGLDEAKQQMESLFV
ncbi:FMN-dependent NADH-azoreductase [Bermanella marisrubri]|uniref:FMN dependent NADH:quinone oxidoreductase n=1 Tax=Bermanella marisrubri TaxID=207949 RepID=Q1MYD7_9GAMM|nr:NAD(P)H-dependent oxidoreductase [Bermanella marisrubri]EAT11008.1 (Acyl-carrier protein) phosphodiesterase [Oceanobacter sp. RED65] [Bermanella marisrubri]QIZ83747.1 FMN-dependent NADH-azoreductase [Bermanella marisrubri]